MEEDGAEVGVGGEPGPVGEGVGLLGVLLLGGGEFLEAGEFEAAVVVRAEFVDFGDEAAYESTFLFFLVYSLFHRPAEAVAPLRIEGFNHQQNRPKLENQAPQKCRDTPSICLLPLKLCLWSNLWQPDEEGVDDPDC